MATVYSTVIYLFAVQSYAIRSLFIIELCEKLNHCWCRLSICCVCLPVNVAFHSSWSFIIFLSKISGSLVQLLLLFLLLYYSCSCHSLNMLCFCAAAINTKALIKLQTNVFQTAAALTDSQTTWMKMICFKAPSLCRSLSLPLAPSRIPLLVEKPKS